MIRGLLILTALYGTAAGALVVACCIVRACDNARVRATRRQMRAEVVDLSDEQLPYDLEFAAIVARLKADA